MLAEPGDTVASFRRDSEISRKIRSMDDGQWSHVAKVNHKGQLLDVGPGGGQVNEFESLADGVSDIALYRLKQQLSEEEKERQLDLLAQMTEKFPSVRYNWRGAIRAIIARRWMPNLKHAPTPSELLNMNLLRLVGYA